VVRLELTASRSQSAHSSQLSYTPWCRERDSNPHDSWLSKDFKSFASTNSATSAEHHNYSRIQAIKKAGFKPTFLEKGLEGAERVVEKINF
jgi:hypothetical protein